MEKIKNFSEINTKEELSELAYRLWKSSSDEYKDKLSSFEEQIKNLYTEAMKYRRIHCAIAGEIAIKIYLKRQGLKGGEENELNNELKLLYFATLIHDIKKFDRKHSKIGAKWININLKKYTESNRYSGDYMCKFEELIIDSEDNKVKYLFGRFDEKRIVISINNKRNFFTNDPPSLIFACCSIEICIDFIFDFLRLSLCKGIINLNC